MPYRLQAIGFPAAATEDGVRSVLNDLASRGHEEGLGVIVATPLPECIVRIRLDANGQPAGLSVLADTALQTVMLSEISHGTCKGFTYIDSRPVHPFEAVVFGDAAPGRTAVRTSFFVHRQGTELAARILSATEKQNGFTGAPVFAGELWIPGLVIPYYGHESAEPGRDVTWRGTLVMEAVSPLSS